MVGVWELKNKVMQGAGTQQMLYQICCGSY